MLISPICAAGTHFKQQCSETIKPPHNNDLLRLATTIFKITLNSVQLDFKLDENGRREAMSQKKSYTNLFGLVKEFTELENKKNLPLFAKIFTFFFPRHDCEFIDNPKTYKEQYLNQIKKETIGQSAPTLLPYGIFEIKVITNPQFIDNETLVFYVHNTIPYKVTIKYPFSSNPEMKYEELPRSA